MSRFKEQVFPPLILNIEVPDSSVASYIEQQISMRDRLAFVCQNSDDQNVSYSLQFFIYWNPPNLYIYSYIMRHFSTILLMLLLAPSRRIQEAQKLSHKYYGKQSVRCISYHNSFQRIWSKEAQIGWYTSQSRSSSYADHIFSCQGLLTLYFRSYLSVFF